MSVLQQFKLLHLFLLQKGETAVLVYGLVKDAEEINQNFFDGAAAIVPKTKCSLLHLMSHVTGIQAEIHDRELNPESNTEHNQRLPPIPAQALFVPFHLINSLKKQSFATSSSQKYGVMALNL
jgi:hypothetical protein